MKVPTIQIPARRLAAGVAVGALVLVIGAGSVTAASPSPAAQPSATGATASSAAVGVTGLGMRLGALRRAVGRNFRVEVQATNKNGTHDILYVRGTLQVGATSLTVTLPDNSTQTFAVDASNVVRDSGKTVPFSDLKDGERAMVFGVKNADGTYTARLIRCVKQPKALAGPSAPAPTTP